MTPTEFDKEAGFLFDTFTELMRVAARREGKEKGRWTNYFAVPDLVVQHVNYAGNQELLVGGVPVMRVYLERGEVKTRFIVGDWEPLD